jgi:hypothetical protein
MKKILIALCVLAVAAAGCKKQNSNGHSPICSSNTVVYYIYPPVPDICQLWITVDTTIYIPVSLDTAFMHDSLKVNLCYTPTGDSDICGFVAYKYPRMVVNSISRR